MIPQVHRPNADRNHGADEDVHPAGTRTTGAARGTVRLPSDELLAHRTDTLTLAEWHAEEALR